MTMYLEVPIVQYHATVLLSAIHGYGLLQSLYLNLLFYIGE